MNKLIKTLLATALTVAASGGTAMAGLLSGNYTVVIYNYDSGGVSANANADSATVAAHTAIATINYTGALNFNLPAGGTNTIGSFLATGGGTSTFISGNAAYASMVLSTATFRTTTLLDFNGTTSMALSGSVTHDDGVSIYQGGNTVLNAASPTSIITHNFALAAGGYRVIYSAANDLPEQLIFNVPEPVSMVLLGAGLIGLGFARRASRA